MKTRSYILLTSLLAIATASAQILYVSPEGTGAQQVGKLRQINPDGSGDTAIALPFSDVALPTWAHSGAQYAVTAVETARPNRISRNVYAITAGTGAVQQVTPFEDNVNPQSQAYTYVYAFYKAFSPDRRLMAVNSFYLSGAPNSSQTSTPTLQVFRTDGQGGSQALVYTSLFRDGVHHAGDGVDWSPVAAKNVLVFPVKTDVTQPNSGGKGEATSIYLAEPVTDGGNNGQLTFPHADQTRNLSTGEVTTFSEHDYQPKFSPDGNKVAYVRSFQNTSNFRSVPDPDIQALRITDGKNDVEITRLQPGQYVTSIDWSPDGTELVFDAGQQSTSNGFYLQAVAPETDALFIIKVDGSGLRQLRGAGSGQPAWAPAATAPAPSQLANIATRLNVLTGDNVLIGGFIPTGTVPKKVVIRGIGPSLTAFGITNALADPVLELHGPDGTTIATNDNWKDDANQASQVQAAGLAPKNDLESALVATLDPNKAYTAIVRGKNAGIGVGLAEVYDIDPTAASKLGNIATRGFVDKGDNAMIGGLIVGPASGSSTKVVVRGIGPSLTAAGVNGALQDPTLEIHDSNGTTIASNDNWQTDANASQVQAANLAPKDARESAIYAVLAPAAYTAVLRGKNDTTGVGLVEVYNVQ